MLTTDVPLPIQPVDLVEPTDQAIVDCDEVLTSDVWVEVNIIWGGRWYIRTEPPESVASGESTARSEGRSVVTPPIDSDSVEVVRKTLVFAVGWIYKLRGISLLIFEEKKSLQVIYILVPDFEGRPRVYVIYRRPTFKISELNLKQKCWYVLLMISIYYKNRT